MKKGIEYILTNENARGQLRSYHSSPTPRNHNRNVPLCDVRSVKTKMVKTSLGYSSPYTIGFEVEKAQISSVYRKEYLLFSGFESDSSCGMEAITNILPLLPPSQWRNKIFDMMYKAKNVLNDNLSPSNYMCGGHITIAVKDITGTQLRERMRLNSAILLALFRKRLTNRYCNQNIRMLDEDHFGRYQVALPKGNCLEFRLPSRIRSFKQMLRRYELMYQIVDFSITRPNSNFNTLLNRVTPILLSMYEQNRDKVIEVKKLAKDFRMFIKTNRVRQTIRPFLNRS